VAPFYCAEAATCQEEVAPLKATGGALSVPLAYNVSMSASAPNYSAQRLAAKQAVAQAFFIADTVGRRKGGDRLCRPRVQPAAVLDGEVLAPSLSTTAGVKKYVIFNNLNAPYYSTQVAGVKTMNAAFKKYQPSVLKSANYSEIAVQTWVSGLLLSAAAKAGGVTSSASPTAAMLVTGLHTAEQHAGWDDATPDLQDGGAQPHRLLTGICGAEERQVLDAVRPQGELRHFRQLSAVTSACRRGITL
jgi:branched-chain amino acid transport system substrate-binding protein